MAVSLVVSILPLFGTQTARQDESAALGVRIDRRPSFTSKASPGNAPTPPENA